MSKKTKQDIWMPLYIADYLADTTRLTTEQHGAYMLLIMDYWRNGAPPDDDSVLANITKLTPQAWRKHRAALSKLFVIADEVWSHKRIDDELKKASDNAIAYANRAKVAAEKRWSKERSSNTQESLSDATSIPSSNHQAVHEDMLSDASSSSPSPTSNYINTQEGEVLELEKLNKYLQRAIVPLVTQERLDSLLDGFNSHYESSTLSSNQRYSKMVQWIKKANTDDKVAEARIQRATTSPKKSSNNESQGVKGKNYYGISQQEIEANARAGESYFDTAKRLSEAKGVTPAQDVEPKPVRAFAGIDLQIFKTIQQLDPKITQQAVIDLAKQQGKDEYTTMVKLHMQLKNDAAKVEVAQ